MDIGIILTNMVQNIIIKKQTPENGENWLYNDGVSGRTFSKVVYLPNTAANWPECTDAEKMEWEREHRPQEPELDASTNQIEDVEVVK